MSLKLEVVETPFILQPGCTESYAKFRSTIPKPTSEDKNLRHIFRFYVSRTLQKQEEQNIYVLPRVKIGEKTYVVDIVSGTQDKYTLAICEPGQISSSTFDLLNDLKDVDNVRVLLIHSRYVDSSKVLSQFKDQVDTKKFRLLAVVPPPFDDVYEYDIWMFETTFRDILSGDN
jgi:hypothetical protein